MEILNEVGRCFLPSHEAFAFMWLLAGMAVVAAAISIERYIAIARHTDYDAQSLYAKLKNLIENKTYDEAFQLCSAAGKRALPRILGAGIRKASTIPELVIDAMTEESLHMTSQLEKRLNYLVMISNAATLLGLLGTVFGLIMSFAAVGKPDIAAAEKTALLAAGISAAMNSTLVGLSLSITCVGIYAWLRSKVESSLSEIDRYAVAVVKLLNPPPSVHTRMSVMKSRHQDEEVADADVTPMLNLMVMLIPLLLTSSEFVRIGAIELKLPESSQGSGGGGSGGELQNQKLDVGIVITSKGFNLFSYFKTDTVKSTPDQPDIPLVNGEYDYITLNSRLAEIKRKALYELMKANFGDAVPQNADLYQLYLAYTKKDLTGNTIFPDHESIKIVAEEKIKYKTVIDVMDAARGTKTPNGNATMFPNVSIAGGIVQ